MTWDAVAGHVPLGNSVEWPLPLPPTLGVGLTRSLELRLAQLLTSRLRGAWKGSRHAWNSKNAPLSQASACSPGLLGVGNGAWKISPITSPPRDRVELVPTPTEFRISLADPQSCLHAQGQPQR